MIIPGIFEKDFIEVKKKIALVEDEERFVHIDIADGKLVDGETFLELDLINTLDSKIDLELHFMVENPAMLLVNPIKNVKRVCSQIEIANIAGFIKSAKNLRYKVGLSLKPNTPISAVEPYLRDIDYIQFMDVNPGGQGREFQESVMTKISEFKLRYPQIEIQVDGGINDETLKKVLSAGVNNVVIGSALFDWIERLQND